SDTHRHPSVSEWWQAHDLGHSAERRQRYLRRATRRNDGVRNLKKRQVNYTVALSRYLRTARLIRSRRSLMHQDRWTLVEKQRLSLAVEAHQFLHGVMQANCVPPTK